MFLFLCCYLFFLSASRVRFFTCCARLSESLPSTSARLTLLAHVPDCQSFCHSLCPLSFCVHSLLILFVSLLLSASTSVLGYGSLLSLAHALCTSLEFCSSLFVSLISSYGNQAFSTWLVIQPSQIFSPSPKRQKTIMLSSI